MRCLTLAEALHNKGAEVSFLSRELPGHMIIHVEAREFAVKRLPAPENPPPEGPPPHAPWAGVEWQRDAEETGTALRESAPDWLVVDHYAFDKRWETAIRRDGMRIMVIDDLADRTHDCDLLLDQNLGREAADYKRLVPEHCKLMIGPRFALLRPEFAEKRAESLARRRNEELKDILIAMGGIDRDNVTARVMKAMQELEPPAAYRVTIVLGKNAPWLADVKELADSSHMDTTVLQGVEDMASLMAKSDLAIGGAGGSSWERCCLGLATLVVVLANNQVSAAQALDAAGAAVMLYPDQTLGLKVKEFLTGKELSSRLTTMSAAAGKLVDGLGTRRVLESLEPAH
jgi:UDP-2,4-diacetamido-2,4,6-trideoxy-beta-L-altropyranose hydrolase